MEFNHPAVKCWEVRSWGYTLLLMVMVISQPNDADALTASSENGIFNLSLQLCSSVCTFFSLHFRCFMFICDKVIVLVVHNLVIVYELSSCECNSLLAGINSSFAAMKVYLNIVL